MLASLKNIYLLLHPASPWLVDFRDSSIVNNATCNSIRQAVLWSLSVLGIILSLGCTWNFFRVKTQKSILEECRAFVLKNGGEQEQLLKNNKVFVEIKDRLIHVINSYQGTLPIYEFLFESIKLKSDFMKLKNILICDNHDVANPEFKRFEIHFDGILLNEDISFLDTYKEKILDCPSLATFKSSCKSFYKIERAKTEEEGVNFNLTIQLGDEK